jgi:hypothetical protein
MPPAEEATEGSVAMTIGAGIFLMAVGAILAFAVNVSISGLDIAVVGAILMIAGAVGIALELAVWGPRRRRAAVYTDPVAPTSEVYEQDTPVVPRTRRFRRVRTTTSNYPDVR